MIEKFGKSQKGYVDLNSVFYDLSQNQEFLKKLKFYNKVYKKQPKRTNCKLCLRKLQIKDIAFERNKIRYFICDNCGQLNGQFQDTVKYNKLIYEKDGGLASIYSKFSKKKFDEKVTNIYLPKVNFLINVLKKQNINFKDLKCCDFGTGSGFMIKALLDRGFKKVVGLEVSDEQVKYGNMMIGKKLITKNNSEEIEHLAEKINAQIVTSIFHLEHIENPLRFLQKIKKNKNIKYLFISVPLYSFGVIFELLFDKVMPRILGECHTHLFTNESLKWIENKLSFKLIGSWWFGSDMFDLHKSIMISLKNKMGNNSIASKFHQNFEVIWDSMQKIIDKKKMCSEVHLVYRVRND